MVWYQFQLNADMIGPNIKQYRKPKDNLIVLSIYNCFQEFLHEK